MKRLAAVGFFLFSVSARADCIPPTEAEIDQIRETFKTDLLDNESARFSDVCKVTLMQGKLAPLTAYCGLINARNSYGAYVGFKPFYSIPRTNGAGFAYDRKDFPNVPSLGYCLSCMPPEKPIDECFQIIRDAISNSTRN